MFPRYIVYPCPTCPKSFTTRAIRDNHRRIHSSEKPYVCDVCYARYTQREGLSNHKKVYHGRFGEWRTEDLDCVISSFSAFFFVFYQPFCIGVGVIFLLHFISLLCWCHFVYIFLHLIWWINRIWYIDISNYQLCII